MAKQKDVWGFDEVEKQFEKMKDKYDSETDAFLFTLAKQAQKRLRQVAPYNRNRKKGKHLNSTYRSQATKKFGDAKVSRVFSGAPHAHLVEYGHESYTVKNKIKTGKLNRYNAIGRRVMGVKKHKRVDGKFLFEKVWAEFERRFPGEAKKVFDSITKGWE